MTLQQQIDAIAALPNVVEAKMTKRPVSIGWFADVYEALVGWYEDDGNRYVYKKQKFVIYKLGVEGEEDARPVNEVQDELKPAPVAEKYFTGRTGGGFTKAQVQSFCDSVWQQAHAGADNIQGFTIQAITSNKAKVSGDFHYPGSPATWKTQAFYLTLVDINGSVTPGNANIRIEQIV